MNTKERILKFLLGRAISRLDYDEAKAQYDAAFEGASDEQKQMAAAYLLSVNNKLSANPRSNKHARHTGAEAYRIATTMLNGTFDPASVVSPLNTDSGIDTRRKDYGRAGNVAADFYLHNQGNKAKSNLIQPAGGAGRYFFEATKGLNRIGERAGTTTRGELVRGYAKGLLNNILAAQGQEGKSTVYGKVDGMYDDIDRLKAILGSDVESDNAYNALLDIAGKYEDGSTWKAWFGAYLPGENKLEKNKKALKDDGYDLVDDYDFGDYANDFSNYKVAKKGNAYYLINPDYSGVATNASKVFMNTDWRDPNKEGHGYIIGNDGSFVLGNLGNYRNDARYKDQINSYLKELDNENRWMGNSSKFNKFTSLSDSDLLNNFAEDLHGQNIADLSRYFNGQDVIATVNGNNFDGLRSQYGHLRIDDPNLTFYYRSKDGLKKGTYQDIIRDLGDITLQSNKAAKGLQNFQSIDYNLDGLDWSDERNRRDIDINRESEWHNWWSPNRELKNGWNNEISASDTSMNGKNSGITNDPGKFARLMLYAYANSDKLNNSKDKNEKELSHTLNNWLENDQTKADLIYVIYEQMSMHPELFKDPRYRTAFQQLLMSTKGSYSGQSKSTEVTQMQKEGGILKAAMGAGLDVNGNPIPVDPKESIAASMRDRANLLTNQRNKLVQQAEENGRTTKQQLEVNRNVWTSSDTLRATALATDIIGLIGAISSPTNAGVGSLVAIGSGFASMAQDAVADFTDEKVSKGLAWKNVGINTGLAVGAMFGAKAPKMVKSAMKIVPKAMMALGAAGVVLDPEVLKTVDKITSGKGLNVNDWKNISIILRTATGIATVGTMSYKGKKAGKEYSAALEKEVKKLKGVSSELDPNMKYVLTEGSNEPIAIKKEVFAEVNAKLKSGKESDINDAVALLTKSVDEGGAGLTSEQASAIRETVTGKKKGWDRLRFWKEAPEEGLRLREADMEQIRSRVGQDVLAEAKLNVARSIRNKAARSHKSALLNKWEQNEFVLRFNPAINAALAGTEYKNINALIAGEKAKLGPVKPSQVVGESKVLTPQELEAIQQQSIADRRQAIQNAEIAEGMNAKKQPLHNAIQEEGVLSKGLQELETAEQELRTLSNELKELQSQAKSNNPGVQRKINNLKQALTDKQNALREIEGRGSKNYKTVQRVRKQNELKAAQQALENKQQQLEAIQSNPARSSAISVQEDGTLKFKKSALLDKATKKQLELFVDDYNSTLNRVNQLSTSSSGKAIKNQATLQQEIKLLQEEIRNLSKSLVSETLLKESSQKRDEAIAAYGRLRSLTLGKYGNSKNVANRRLSVLQGDESTNGSVKQLTKQFMDSRAKTRLAGNDAYQKAFESRISKAGSTITDLKMTSGQVIPKGTSVVSYIRIGDAAMAEAEALRGRDNIIRLSQEDIKKLPSNIQSNIRGAAYDQNAKQLVLWKNGGKVNYQKLRK